MPVRNACPYLEDCLKSIINQSFTNWELIAINDHSTDQSLSILQDYSLKDSRIHCKQNPGKGIIDGLTFGYSFASGDFITRMDADDLMPLNKLLVLKTILENSGVGHLSTGKVKYISSSELGSGFKKYEQWLNNLCDTDSHYQEVYKECVIPSPCWLMYREDFESVGGFKSKQYPEDYDLCFRMYANQIKVVPSLEILHLWRDHSERASRNDENYSDNRFLDLKVKYFLEVDYQAKESLVLWGAGKKGKRIAQLLQNEDIVFTWITDNEKKVGKHIYSKKMSHSKTLVSSDASNTAIIIAVANEDDQREIDKFIKINLCSSRILKFC